MQHNRDPLDPTYQAQPEAAPSGGPPQFNESYCGYRCGEGCCEPSEGDSESDGDGDGVDVQSQSGSAGTTIIGDEQQNLMLERARVQMNFVVRGTPAPEHVPMAGEIERGTGLLILRNGFQRRVMTHHSPSASSRMRSYDGVRYSMLPGPSTGYMSSARTPYYSRSREIPSPRSPGSVVRGSGSWEENHINALPPLYLFLTPPLRLSSQDGLEGQHSDVDSLLDFLEGYDAARPDRLF